MKITHTMIGNLLTIHINEHITGMQEVGVIKTIVKANDGFDTIKLDIVDAFVIPSALIGYLMKLTNIDKKNISIIAHQKELNQLLIDLQLDQLFRLNRG